MGGSKRGTGMGRMKRGAGAALAALCMMGLAAAAARAQDAPDPKDWREVEPDRLIVMDTTKGRILIETAPEFAPNHVARFTQLIRQGFYDGIIFHRVIDDFMDQTGDPKGDGTGGSGQNIKAEFTVKRDASLPVVEVGPHEGDTGGLWHGMPIGTQPIAQASIRADGKVESWITHCAGVVSTARSENPNSADSQFFIMRRNRNDAGNRNTFLDKQYTAWGKVVGGMDAALAMNVGTVSETRGFQPDKMTRVKIAADLPARERPRVWVQRDAGPGLQAEIARLAEARGGVEPDVCDVEVKTIVKDPGAS